MHMNNFIEDLIKQMEGRNMERKFEKVSKYEGIELEMPKRATATSVGYDFYNPKEVVIGAGKIEYVMTGIKAKFPENEALILANRSSNPKKKGLMLANGIGVIEADYYNNVDNEGELGFAFMNITNEPIVLDKGEKLGQGFFIEYKITSDDNTEGVRTGGFGSTGK